MNVMVDGREEWIRGVRCKFIDSLQSRCQVVESLCVVVVAGIVLFLSVEKKHREMMIEIDAKIVRTALGVIEHYT